MSIFNEVIGYKPKKTAFNLNHEYRGTTKFGVLTPVLCREVLPSDKWKFSCETFTRFQPLLSPVMHRINAFEHYWFVPNRIVWSDWDKFISPRGVKDEERPVLPHLHFDGLDENLNSRNLKNFALAVLGKFSLFDYLGINTRITSIEEIEAMSNGQLSNLFNNGMDIQLLPLLGYQMIFWQYYADENLYDINAEIDDLKFWSKMGQIKTSELTSNQMRDLEDIVFQVRFRAYEKDYFTSALPNTQRGEDITLGSLSVKMPKMQVEPGQEVVSGVVSQPNGDPVGQTGYLGSSTLLNDRIANVNDNGGTITQVPVVVNGTVVTSGNVVDENGEPIEDTEIEVNPVTINELRRAVKLQEFLERSMRGGYRLIEQIKSHFGVTSSDARLDIPQYLGGDTQKVIISELSSMAGTDDNSLGEFSGHATQLGKTKRRSFFSEEHGFIFCIYSVIPRTSYSQGVERQFTRTDWLDYAWPEFSHLGEQEVKNKELYVSIGQNQTKNDEVFGYQSRYAEYKTIPSSIHGSFRDNMDYWTLTRIFSSLPTYSKDFVECKPDDANNVRIFTTERSWEDYLTLDVYHAITCVRPLPRFGVPML